MDGKKEGVSRFEKVYDYLEAIIALAEKELMMCLKKNEARAEGMGDKK